MPLPAKLPTSSSKSMTFPNATEKPAEVLANRYFVQKTLGNGNCGTALLVLDRKDKEGKDKHKVAKKVFIGNLQPNETVDASSEASLLRNLDHPDIVKFYDSFIEGDFFYIVTEYCEGGDLDRRIIDQKKIGEPFSEQQITEWLVQMLLALQYMHSRRILHRDLKTRNIFLRANRIKIGDFGISRILIGTLDMALTFAGTPFYMSPEVLKHEGYNSKSDIWSVGCILYELAALQRCFDGTTLMGVMYKITEVDPPVWPPGYSDDLGDLFRKMLEKDPSQRPSATDALHCPYIYRQIETMKSTIFEKHHFRNQQDVVESDVVKIATAVKNMAKVNELQEESNIKRFRYLPPRDRMRMQKQIRADQEAEKIKNNTILQKLENQAKSDRVREKNDPYKSKISLGTDPSRGSSASGGHRKAVVNDRSNFELNTPRTAPILRGPNYDDDEFCDDDDEDDVSQTIVIGKSRRPATSLSSEPGGPFQRQFLDDDRPITPMKNATIYRSYSAGDSDEYAESDDADNDEVQQMFENFERCLDDKTLTDQTLVADDKEAGAFGPRAKDNKIKNLRADAVGKLGEARFNEVYTYLKKTRFDERAPGKEIDENKVRYDLRRICSNADYVFLVEQLLFLEMSNHT